MKRLLAIIALLVVVAVLAVFTIQRRGDNPALSHLPTGRAAELAPADTDVFIEIPNLDRTLARWKQTGLYAISQEPEWQQFIAKWDDFARENADLSPFIAVLDDLKKVDSAGFFLALAEVSDFGNIFHLPSLATSPLDLDFPKLVGGFPYRGKKTVVEGVVQKLRERLFKTWPDAKSVLTKYGEVEIETITSGTPFSTLGSIGSLRTPPPPTPPKYPQVSLAYRDNWFFFATDPALLTGMLDRYLRKPGATKSLAETELFSTCVKQGVAEPDLTVWSRWQPFGTYLERKSVENPKSIAKILVARSDFTPNAVDPEAVHFTGQLDGALLRDRLYFHLPNAPPKPALATRSLALSGTDSYACAAIDYSMFCDFIAWLPSNVEGSLSVELERSLAEYGLTLADLRSAFGPEIALLSSWPDHYFYPDPDFVLAVEVRDVAKARKFLTSLHGTTPNRPPDVTTVGDTTRWLWDAGILGGKRQTEALTKTLLLLGDSQASVDRVLAQLTSPTPTIESKPGSPFPAARAASPPANGAFVYVDAKTLFERLHRKYQDWAELRLIGLSLQHRPWAQFFAHRKLPPATATIISKHLQPLTIGVRTEGQGWVVESAGTVNLIGPHTVPLLQAALIRLNPLAYALASREEEQPFAAQDLMAQLEKALAEYQAQTGAWPTTAQGLSALVTQPTLAPIPATWKQILPELPIDPWGHPFRYLSPGKRRPLAFDVFSSGVDGKPGTEDDLRTE